MENCTSTKRTDEEIKEIANQQLLLLKQYCKSYDDGELMYSGEISTKLRIWFKSGSVERSLFDLIIDKFKGKKSYFPDFCEPLPSHGNRVISGLTDYSFNYLPDSNDENLIPKPKFNHRYRLCSFDKWWNENIVIYCPGETNVFTRKDVVCYIAEKDGGAHVDEKLGNVLMRLKRNKYNTLTINIDGELGERTYTVDTNLLLQAAVRTIAAEALIAIDEQIVPLINK